MKIIRTKSDTVISRDLSVERYLKDIRNTKPLTFDQERIYIRNAQEGDKSAADKLVTANLKFVVMCAKEYQQPGIDIMDLIQAGNEGLIDAVLKFNLVQEIKFISYAVWHIKRVIIEYIKENYKTIRLPFNQQDELQRIFAQKEKMEKEFEGSVPIHHVLDVYYNQETPSENIMQALSCHGTTASLDEPVSQDDAEMTLGELVTSKDSDFTTVYEEQHRKRLVNLAMVRLSQTQKRVISLAFGLEDNIIRTNQDIADQLNLTAERVRQIRQKALLKLKSCEELKAVF